MTTTDIELPPIWQADSQQQVFRALLDAMAYPGSVIDVPHAPAQTAVLATLVDQATSLADAGGLLSDETWRFLATRRASVDTAAYVVVDGRQPPGDDFAPSRGTSLDPETSATLIVAVDELAPAEAATTWRLTGPGIADQVDLGVTGLDPAWISRRNDWCSLFPLGVDLILTDHQAVAALPRTTTIVAAHPKPGAS